MRRFLEILILLALSYFVWQGLGYAAISESDAIHAILGEARGESYIGKLAVAEALRRRDSLHGVYGANVAQRLLNLEKPAIWADALKAWRQSKTSNLVPNCKYWFSDADLKKLNSRRPKWFKELKFYRKIGHQSFFRTLIAMEHYKK